MESIPTLLNSKSKINVDFYLFKKYVSYLHKYSNKFFVGGKRDSEVSEGIFNLRPKVHLGTNTCEANYLQIKVLSFCFYNLRSWKNKIPKIVIELGVILRKIRKEKKMSIEEVAFKAGIDSQNLRRYELGKQEMKISMLKRISDAMKVSIADITNRFS